MNKYPKKDALINTVPVMDQPTYIALNSPPSCLLLFSNPNVSPRFIASGATMAILAVVLGMSGWQTVPTPKRAAVMPLKVGGNNFSA